MINLYPEMNEKIADILGMSEEPMYLYASEYIKQLQTDIADLRNFACQLCGKYKTAHEGSCDGCRWRKI